MKGRTVLYQDLRVNSQLHPIFPSLCLIFPAGLGIWHPRFR